MKKNIYQSACLPGTGAYPEFAGPAYTLFMTVEDNEDASGQFQI